VFPWIDTTIDIRRQTIAVGAGAELAHLESPLGSNQGPEIAGYLEAGQIAEGGPWCAAFATWVWSQVGVPTPPAGYHPALVADWARWAHATGRFRSIDEAEIGDVVLYAHPGAVPHHCGIAVRLEPLLLVVEGNTDETGSAEGIGVFLRDRTAVKRSYVYGAVTPLL
jgi:hypothetical protein